MLEVSDRENDDVDGDGRSGKLGSTGLTQHRLEELYGVILSVEDGPIVQAPPTLPETPKTS